MVIELTRTISLAFSNPAPIHRSELSLSLSLSGQVLFAEERYSANSSNPKNNNLEFEISSNLPLDSGVLRFSIENNSELVSGGYHSMMVRLALKLALRRRQIRCSLSTLPSEACTTEQRNWCVLIFLNASINPLLTIVCDSIGLMMVFEHCSTGAYQSANLYRRRRP